MAKYIAKGPSKGTKQVCATARRLMRARARGGSGFSQNEAAKAVGMTSSGLKLALTRDARLARRKTPCKDGRGAATRLTDAQRARLLRT